MQPRLNQNDVTNRVNVEDSRQVRDAVFELFATRYPGADLSPLVRAFDDVNALFEGRYPGYLRCDTLYHDAAPHPGHDARDGAAASTATTASTPGADRARARAAPCSAWSSRCCTTRAT